MLLSEAESNIDYFVYPSEIVNSLAVVDLMHADTHFVRNSGGPDLILWFARREAL
jgi:hypothetical protein